MERNADRLKPEFHGEINVNFDIAGFTVISSILACIALTTGSIPVLIGAMILAPTFDPLIAIPFGLLNKDWRLVKEGVFASLLIFGLAFMVAMLTTFIIRTWPPVSDPLSTISPQMITERLTVGWHHVVVAFAAGAGGALASASDHKSNLVGVVVALALVPALAAASIGFLIGPLPGWGGLMLFAVNVLGIVLSGLVVLFLRMKTGQAEDAVQ